MTLDAVRTPPPDIDDDVLREVLRAHWGLHPASLTRLGAERDINVLVDGRYVLKVVNPAEPRQIAEMQVAALAHLRGAAPDLPLPEVVPGRSGDALTTVADAAAAPCAVWLVTALSGADREGKSVDEAIAAQMGAVAARVQHGLHGFFHPAARRAIGWDLRQLPAYVGESAVLADLAERVGPALRAAAYLPGAVQHADITLSNVLFSPGADGRPAVNGVIDLGDMHHTAAVCDLAITVASVLRNTAEEQVADLWQLLAAVLDGYQRHRLLEPDEAAVLGELVLARLGVTEAIAALHEDRNARGADNTHITRYREANRRVWGEMAALSTQELARRIGRMAGTSRAPQSVFMTPPAPTGDPATSRDSPSGADPGRDLGQRRRTVMGGALSPLFYDRPLHIVRGHGPWLFTADGNRLLDAYNNVAVIGHAHPAVTQAVTRQISALNTHSRYLHEGVVELAERILATMPEELDTCLFTTSGTEANELAWRIATAATGGTAALVAEHSYHGSTKWMADLSPNEWPAGYRAPHVGLFEAPHGLGPDSDPSIAADRIARAAAGLGGERPALVLADSMFTSEGVLEAPAPYLEGLGAGAHAVGALYLADEVQAGYGRTGPQLWRFALSGVVPDFVSLGKPMGAGYPIGALVTRSELARSLAADYEYFSTFAATPVAAAAGLAVLDVLEDQQLPARAAEVGAYLREQVRALGHERIGEVRGIGLVAGIDLLAPESSESAESARTWARRVLNALVERGVMAGLTGPSGTVLKVRPPLVWRIDHVDLFVDALESALGARH